MQSLGISANHVVRIVTCNLPVGRFVKLQPQSVDFLDISNPRAVYVFPLVRLSPYKENRLEKKLRAYPALTKGETIYFHYAGKVLHYAGFTLSIQEYFMKVLELAPGNAISIINADVEVDFAPPVGYVEPQRPAPKPATATYSIEV